jgi:Transposase Tn5 dimerisation domain
VQEDEEAQTTALHAVYGWWIEDFHRTWKRGHCNVEDTQLRTTERVIRWATMLATVATRVERLKHLARTQPDAPATIELSALELEALRAAKHKIKSRVETIPDGVPSIAQAVRWIADLGGYTGKSSGGPPGSTTIGRGLERLLIWTDAFACARKPLNK